MKLREFITVTVRELLSESVNAEVDENKLKKLYHSTYIYNGTIDTYHLSTNSNLMLNGDFKSERGGGGDYIYSSLNYKEWLKVFDKEKLGERPTYLYILRLKNPKYKSSFELFGSYTPSEFLSTEDQTKIIKFVGKVK